MLTMSILLPLGAALLLALTPRISEHGARVLAVLISAVPLLLLFMVWLSFNTSMDAPHFQQLENASWIPSLGVAWRLGIDGISLVLSLMSALIFVAAIAWPADTQGRGRQYYGWFLFLQGVSLGLFLTLDLLLFYVFFDLSLLGMYFLIGRWGHGDARAAALKFFIYTLAGSLLLLLAIIALYLASDPLTFDMRELIAQQPLTGDTGQDGWALVVMLALLLGFGIKTPLFPVHTWLPPAHVNAPGPASAVLAAVLLKMGTYGLVRVAMSMMEQTFVKIAFPLAIIAVISILWGALVALAQTNLKRRIAYTSVNHMGYTVLGIAVAGSQLGTETARQMALTGATVEMVAHGLITGTLFLICGAFWQRGQEYEISEYGGIAQMAPKLAVATCLAAFASLGLPGLAGFVAEFQIFVGAFAVYPWLAAIGLLGILITAALFLRLLQQLFFGELPARWQGFADLSRVELVVIVTLLLLVVVIGVYPTWLLNVIDNASQVLVRGA